jgi:hypothetical protein
MDVEHWWIVTEVLLQMVASSHSFATEIHFDLSRIEPWHPPVSKRCLTFTATVYMRRLVYDAVSFCTLHVHEKCLIPSVLDTRFCFKPNFRGIEFNIDYDYIHRIPDEDVSAYKYQLWVKSALLFKHFRVTEAKRHAI